MEYPQHFNLTPEGLVEDQVLLKRFSDPGNKSGLQFSMPEPAGPSHLGLTGDEREAFVGQGDKTEARIKVGSLTEFVSDVVNIPVRLRPDDVTKIQRVPVFLACRSIS